jgi:hypothetical protein
MKDIRNTDGCPYKMNISYSSSGEQMLYQNLRQRIEKLI